MTDETSVGKIGPDTPIGSDIIMDDGDEYTLTGHVEERSSFLLAAGIGSGDLDGEHTYDEWEKDYAPFVNEVRLPQGNSDEPQAEAQSHLARTIIYTSVPADEYAEVAAAREEVKGREEELAAAKESHVAAKKALDDAQGALNRAIDRMLGRGDIRQDGWPADAPLAEAADAGAELDVERQEDSLHGGSDESWRSVELSSLFNPGIRPGVLKALAENDPVIQTMGSLADWQAAKGEFWSKDIHGLGKAGLDNLSAATDAFWARQQKKGQ